MNSQSTNATYHGNHKLLQLSYQIFLFALFPLALIITIKDALRRRGGIQFITQRFGFGIKPNQSTPIWIHAASIGEVNAALPLIIQIKKQQPTLAIIVTTATATAATTLKQKHPALAHCFLPLDYTGAIKRFLNTVRPRLALILETELWPNLFNACHNNEIPIIIINGRISNKTLHTSHWQQALYRTCLQQCAQILTRSQNDHKRFLQLGANPELVKTIGNLKFSINPSNITNSEQRPIQAKYILAASTHDNEEKIIAECWQKLQHHDYKLVLVPRHPERRLSIIKALKHYKLNIAIRSLNENVTNNTDIYLADTIGELFHFMRYAEIVFMGGSLIPHGGQNILEPASLGKAIITGPHMQNFEDETEQLLSNQAIIQIDGAEALEDTLRRLLNDEQERQQLGHAALALIKTKQKTAETYYQVLVPVLNSDPNNSSSEE